MFAGGTTSHLILNPSAGRQRDHLRREFTGLLEIGRSILRSAPSRFTTRNISILPSVACFALSSVTDRLAVTSGSAWVSVSSASTASDFSMPSIVLCMNNRCFKCMFLTRHTGRRVERSSMRAFGRIAARQRSGVQTLSRVKCAETLYNIPFAHDMGMTHAFSLGWLATH